MGARGKIPKAAMHPAAKRTDDEPKAKGKAAAHFDKKAAAPVAPMALDPKTVASLALPADVRRFIDRSSARCAAAEDEDAQASGRRRRPAAAARGSGKGSDCATLSAAHAAGVYSLFRHAFLGPLAPGASKLARNHALMRVLRPSLSAKGSGKPALRVAASAAF